MRARPSAQMGVYRITGPGRVYIGSSDDIPRRRHSHLSQLRGGRHHNYRLQAAWTEYGEAALAFAVIEEVSDLTDLIGAEQRQLNAALAAGPVYNLALDVSTAARGLVHTAESRLKSDHHGRSRPARRPGIQHHERHGSHAATGQERGCAARIQPPDSPPSWRPYGTAA